MIISETSFAQAVEEFKKFLAENNLPTEILWVFLEDTFSRNIKSHETHFWLKLPLPEENKKLAERQFKIGQQTNLGMSIYAFALCENKVCCHIVIPRDKEDSEYLFMSPIYLMLSFATDMPIAKEVRSSVQWKIFSLLPFKYRQGNFCVYLQSKRDLQFGIV